MCYDVAYIMRKNKSFERRFGASYYPGNLPEAVYHTNGFDHRDIPVITNKDPGYIQFFSWGLIPFWVKDPQGAETIRNKTINAKAETLLGKPSFKHAVTKRRCLVLVDGFFEHHHHKGKTYPFFIQMKDQEPFAIGGIWEHWRYEGIERYTCALITTTGNELLAQIHNNPKLEGPRMPFILPRHLERTWLDDSISTQDVLSIIAPYEREAMEAYTVPRLRGKQAIGNRPEAVSKVEYKELANTLLSWM